MDTPKKKRGRPKGSGGGRKTIKAPGGEARLFPVEPLGPERAQVMVPPVNSELACIQGRQDPQSMIIKRGVFLEELKQGWTISRACRTASLGRSTVDVWRKNDPEFAAELLAAEDEGTERLEDFILERATDAVSPNAILAMFVMKKRKPEYREAYKIETTIKREVNTSNMTRWLDDMDRRRDEAHRIAMEQARELASVTQAKPQLTIDIVAQDITPDEPRQDHGNQPSGQG